MNIIHFKMNIIYTNCEDYSQISVKIIHYLSEYSLQL